MQHNGWIADACMQCCSRFVNEKDAPLAPINERHGIVVPESRLNREELNETAYETNHPRAYRINSCAFTSSKLLIVLGINQLLVLPKIS